MLPRGTDEKSLLLGFLCSPPALGRSPLFTLLRLWSSRTPPALWCFLTFPWRTRRQLKWPCRWNNSFNFLLCTLMIEMVMRFLRADISPMSYPGGNVWLQPTKHGVILEIRQPEISDELRRWLNESLTKRKLNTGRKFLNKVETTPVLQWYFFFFYYSKQAVAATVWNQQ